MEKGGSEYAEYWSYEGSDSVHAGEHAQEFGLNKDSLEEYNQAAKNFVKTKEKGNMLFVKKNGSVYKYNPNTKQFAVITKDGKIVTYFKTSLRYFLNEFKKGGDYWLYKGDEDE